MAVVRAPIAKRFAIHEIGGGSCEDIRRQFLQSCGIGAVAQVESFECEGGDDEPAPGFGFGGAAQETTALPCKTQTLLTVQHTYRARWATACKREGICHARKL